MNADQELTPKSFWSEHWDVAAAAYQPLSGYEAHVWKRIFGRLFASAKPGETCIEVGCGNSRLLPWIARFHGLTVTGLDYTENGCRLASRQLEDAGIKGTVYQRDIFQPNEDLQHRFDYVVSFGLVEHFEDPSALLEAMRQLLKPSGRILTTTPNVTPHALNVLVHRLIAPKTLSLHKLMTLQQLRLLHEQSGFKTVGCTYEGMGLCLACDHPTPTHRCVQAAAYRTIQALRRSLDLLHFPSPQGFFTGLYMVYIGQQ